MISRHARRRSRLCPPIVSIIEDRSVIKVFRRSFVAGLLSLGLALLSPHGAEAQAQALWMQHPDLAEAHAAFKDKREPKYL